MRHALSQNVLRAARCRRRNSGVKTSLTRTRKENHMLWTIFVVLLVLWALGMVSSYTLGGFIHLLLVLAIVAVLIQLISGRRVV